MPASYQISIDFTVRAGQATSIRRINQNLRNLNRAVQMFNTRAARMPIASTRRGFLDLSIATRQASGSLISFGRVAEYALGFLVGQIAYRGLMALRNAMLSIPQTGIAFHAQMETLAVTISKLIANTELAAGSVEDLSQAMEIGRKASKEIIDELIRFSMHTPFTPEQVSSTYAYALALSFTKEQAKDVTKAVLDLASVYNDPTLVQRVIIALGQIAIKGKLAGEEVRQLVNAYVPLWNILPKKLGLTRAELQKLIDEGKLYANVVIPALIQGIEEHVGGLAQELGRTTLRGMLVRLRTSIILISGELTEGLFEPIKRGVNELIIALQDERVRSAAQRIGQNIADALVDLPQKMYDWGAEAVFQFAVGMTEGAIAAISMAMDTISALLEWWLAPGSPPRVAPKLDVWGMRAMEEYLRGFTRADFDVLESLQRSFKQALRFLGQAGVLGEADVRNLYKSLSLDLSSFISGDESALQRVLASIRERFGPLTDVMTDLVRLTGDWVRNLRLVEELKRRIQQLDEGLQKTADRIVDRSLEYWQALRGRASKEVLRRRMQEVNLEKQRLFQLYKERYEKNKSLRDAQRELDTLNERRDLLERILRQLTDVFEVQRKISRGGGGGGRGRIGKPRGKPEIPAPFKEGPLPERFLAGDFLNVEEQRSKLVDFLSFWKEKFMAEISDDLDQLNQSWKRLSENIDLARERLQGFGERFKIDNIWRDYGRVMGLAGGFLAVGAALNLVIKLVQFALSPFLLLLRLALLPITGISQILSGYLTVMSSSLGAVGLGALFAFLGFQNLRTIWGAMKGDQEDQILLWEGLNDTIEALIAPVNALGTALGALWDIISGIRDRDLNKIKSGLDELNKAMLTLITPAEIRGLAAASVSAINKTLDDLGFSTKIPTIFAKHIEKADFSPAAQEIQEGLETSLEEINWRDAHYSWLRLFTQDLTTTFQDTKDSLTLGQELVLAFQEQMVAELLGGKLGSTATVFTEALHNALSPERLQPKLLPTSTTISRTLHQTLKSTILTDPGFLATGDVTFTRLKAAMEAQKWDLLGKLAAEGLVSGLEKEMQALQVRIAAAAGSMRNAAEKGLQIESPAKIMYPVGQRAAEGLVFPFVEAMRKFQPTIARTVQQAFLSGANAGLGIAAANANAAGGTGQVVININGYNKDPRELANEIVWILKNRR